MALMNQHDVPGTVHERLTVSASYSTGVPRPRSLVTLCLGFVGSHRDSAHKVLPLSVTVVHGLLRCP